MRVALSFWNLFVYLLIVFGFGVWLLLSECAVALFGCGFVLCAWLIVLFAFCICIGYFTLGYYWFWLVVCIVFDLGLLLRCLLVVNCLAWLFVWCYCWFVRDGFCFNLLYCLVGFDLLLYFSCGWCLVWLCLLFMICGSVWLRMCCVWLFTWLCCCFVLVLCLL